MKNTVLILALMTVATLAPAQGGAEDPPPPAPAPQEGETPPGASVRQTPFGTVVIGGTGQAPAAEPAPRPGTRVIQTPFGQVVIEDR